MEGFQVFFVSFGLLVLVYHQLFYVRIDNWVSLPRRAFCCLLYVRVDNWVSLPRRAFCWLVVLLCKLLCHLTYMEFWAAALLPS